MVEVNRGIKNPTQQKIIFPMGTNYVSLLDNWFLHSHNDQIWFKRINMVKPNLSFRQKDFDKNIVFKPPSFRGFYTSHLSKNLYKKLYYRYF